jgi:hypothetical protein
MVPQTGQWRMITFFMGVPPFLGNPGESQQEKKGADGVPKRLHATP